ncbi:MAG: hypothetical protein LUH15_05460 [Tannerellaceae bacterium]|nr:hypothetical protein [Tannerellaceae bacterium]
MEFQWNQRTPNIFTLQTTLKEGEIKILTARDFGSYTFKPLEANGSIQNSTCQGENGGEDLKWVISEDEAGDYLITLNTVIPSIEFTKID